MSELANKAMLARLSIHGWSGNRQDKEASRQIERQKNAQGKVGRYVKDLIVSDNLELYNRMAGAARRIHNEFTLPWLDDGSRLLPGEVFFEYRDNINYLRGEAMKAAEAFFEEYPYAKQRAAKRLGDLYNEADYPNVEKLRNKFGFDLAFLPIPSADDWRVDIGEAEKARIQEDVEQRMKQAEHEAMQDLWNRLFTAVNHMHERLADENNIFRDSMVENLEELADLLPKMNVADDPELDNMTQEVRAKLLGQNPDTLRHDKHVRSQTASEAEDIVRRMRGFFG